MSPEIDYPGWSKEQLVVSQKEGKPYSIFVKNKEIIVYPNVFSPKYFKDSEFFVDNINVSKGESFLEIGSGTGIVSVFAAFQGANVSASDINPDAVSNTQANVALHNLDMPVFQGDLFSSFAKEDKFDSIFFNIPFGCTTIPNSILQKALFDPEYKTFERFIREGKKHLFENGRFLIGFSKTIGDIELINKIVEEQGCFMQVMCEKDVDYGAPIGIVNLGIYKITKK